MPDVTLAPCPVPWCKGKGNLDSDDGEWYVTCTDCDTTTRSFYTPEEAEALWNQRTLPPLVESVIEAAKAERLANRAVFGGPYSFDELESARREYLRAKDVLNDAVDALLASESEEPT